MDGPRPLVDRDSVMATFDTPARAVRCASACAMGWPASMLRSRRVHTGEIKRRSDGVGGIGVHIAARVMAQAGASEVVVTRTVRDLATGSDLAFRTRGRVALRGVPSEWELFDVGQS